MRFSHLLVLGLIAFIVFRLTQSVQNPRLPEPEQSGAIEAIQTGGELPTSGQQRDQANSDRRNRASAALKTVFQRLMEPAPAATPRVAASSDLAPSQSPAPSAAAPVLTPRERLRMSEARRPAWTRQYGAPRVYQGMLVRHLDLRTVLVRSREEGELMVEDYEPGERQSDGNIVEFHAWNIGSEKYTDSEGTSRTRRRLVHSAPALPLWDKYGRAINRDVLPPETVQQAELHSATMLDQRPR